MYYNEWELKEWKMDYYQARKYIKDAEQVVTKMGLLNIKMLLEKVGNPQDDLKFIHIAGTNGKGSVLASISTILTEAGYRIGRYISPTIYSYRERIQVNGENIEREAFAKHLTKLAEAISQMEIEGLDKPSPFEIETALSFLYFSEKKCDLVVLESGMGGRDDATNIVANTIMAVLTPISMDHMEYLGNSLIEIALNKAGIIKPEAVVVSARQEPEVEEAIWAHCTESGNALVVAKPQEAVVRESTLTEQTFRYHGEEVTITLAGTHQIENAVLVLECIGALNHLGYNISKENVQTGFLKTKWNGRFTIVSQEPYFIVDGAHNPAAAEKLRQSLKLYFPKRRFIFIMGILKDKQYDKIAEIMTPMADWVFTIEAPDNPRALEAKELAATVAQYNHHVIACESIEDAVRRSFKAVKDDDVIVAFGSLSFIGAMTRAATGEKSDD